MKFRISPTVLRHCGGPNPLLVTLLSLVVLCGCASSVSMSQSEIASINSVTVSRNVTMPDEIYYQGKKESILAGTLGVVGAAIAEGGKTKTEDAILAKMKDANIDVGSIVADEFVARLEKAGSFGDVASDCDACPEFSLLVKIYGFAQPHGLSSQLKPMLGVEGSLERPDGSVVWKKYAYITNLNDDTPSHTLDEYLEQPELMSEAFTTAAQFVASKLVDHLQGR